MVEPAASGPAKLDGRDSDLGVVHLVRRANGEEPFRRFLDSYRRRNAGTPHDLVLLMKGFASEDEVERYRALAGDVSSRSVEIDDAGYDLNAYLAVARRVDYPQLCFLNSFSVIEAEPWLAPLVAAHRDGVGLVGATGSWGSQLTYIRYDLGLGGLYARLMGDRRRARARLRELAAVADGSPTLRRKALGKTETAINIVRRCMTFEPFPAHHIRTNAFLIARDVLAHVRSGRQRDKLDAFRLESGRRSLSRQVESMGLRTLVVGRDGNAYERGDWPRSRTFWQGRQENLLVADNQTTAYRDADPELRAILSRFAWGPAAEPAD